MRKKYPVLADILPPDRNNFAAIRLAMALSVLVSHSYWLATGRSALEPLHAWTQHSLGEHAVQVFFFLSGVVVAQSLFKSRSLIDFASARVLRIFPALIACVLLTALVLGPLVTGASLKAYFADQGVLAYIAKTISLSTGSAPLPGVFGGVPLPRLVNLSLWTLKYEVICYALLAGFGFAAIRFPACRNVMTAGLAIVIALIFAGAPKPIAGYTMADNIRYFILFFGAGTLAYLVRDRLVLTWIALPPLFMAFAFAIGTRFAELTSALFLGYATLMIASLSLPRLRWFTNDQDYSFGVYIFACPIQQMLLDQRPGTGPLELTLVAICIVLPLAILSWQLIERPAMRLRPPLVAWIRRKAGLLEDRPAIAGTGRQPRIATVAAIRAMADTAPLVSLAPLKAPAGDKQNVALADRAPAAQSQAKRRARIAPVEPAALPKLEPAAGSKRINTADLLLGMLHQRREQAATRGFKFARTIRVP